MVTIELIEGVVTLVGAMKIEDTNGDNGAGSGIEASGAIDGGYVNQVDNGMS